MSPAEPGGGVAPADDLTKSEDRDRDFYRQLLPGIPA